MPQAMNKAGNTHSLSQFRSTALVAAGSNTRLGTDSLPTTIDRALTQLAETAGVIRSVSRYYSTPAFPPGSGPDFVNAAFAWSSDLSPREMLDALHEVERSLGRVRKERWGARTIDLDLIAVTVTDTDTVLPDAATVQAWIDLPSTEQQARAPTDLILPHPRVQDRAFVLVPLCDIAPDWRHPLLGTSAEEMRARLPQADLDSVIPLENHAKRT